MVSAKAGFIKKTSSDKGEVYYCTLTWAGETQVIVQVLTKNGFIVVAFQPNALLGCFNEKVPNKFIVEINFC